MLNAAAAMNHHSDPQARARANMIEGQLRPNHVLDPALLAAMGSVPRELFVAPELAGVAYSDGEVAAAAGRKLLSPLVFARLVLAAQVRPSDRVLDVGAATGYSGAVLAELAGEVVALESDPSLLRVLQQYQREYGPGALRAALGNLADGFPAAAPYQAIFIEGGVQWVPEALLAQLAPGGRLACVISRPGAWPAEPGKACLFTKQANGGIASTELFDAFASPLSGFTLRPGFQF